MNYKKLAEDILQNVGGTGNVAGLTHCATRLRFNLKEESRAKTEVIKKLKGVMGVVSSGDQYQIIIGSDVGSVFKEGRHWETSATVQMRRKRWTEPVGALPTDEKELTSARVHR
ncbi:MAG: PTS transporter subunit EIIB [Hungatella sp.]